MRTPSNASALYAPNDPPADPAQLQRYLREEMAKIAACVGTLAAGHLDKTYAPPAKPRDGDWRYADGTTWNPGSGQGFYYFNGVAWSFLG